VILLSTILTLNCGCDRKSPHPKLPFSRKSPHP